MPEVNRPFRHAILKKLAPTFAQGLTTQELGLPDYEKACAQHAAYARALESQGLALTVLEADPGYPDSTFIEDTAVVTGTQAILTRPGAPSRAGEVEGVTRTLERFFPKLNRIEPPGTVDGGDVCEAGKEFFIGVSRRTNEAGASQLASFLSREGYGTTLVDIREKTFLHLKTAIAFLPEGTFVVWDEIAPDFQRFDSVVVAPEERHGANCLGVNGSVLLPARVPRLEAALRARGYRTLELDMSEFEKMDGGLSCLSLRF